MKYTSTLHHRTTLWHFSSSATGLLLFATLTIATTFFVVHQQRLAHAVARAHLVADILFDTSPESAAHTITQLEQKAQRLMELDGYISVALFNEGGKPTFELGLPLDDITPPNIPNQKRWSHGNSLYSLKAIEYLNNNTTKTSGTLIITFDKTFISLLNLQFLFVTALILFGTMTFSIFYYRRLNNDIFKPLDQLNEILSKKNKIRDISPVQTFRQGIYEELVAQLNESISIQIENQIDEKNNVEVAMQELRESLETVEIHNIDLDLARKNAVELNIQKSDFLKKISQDLRTPLSGILGFSDLLRKTPLSREQREFIATIEDSTKGILTIVSDIYDFSRIESGSLAVDRKVVEIRQNIEEMLTLQAPLSSERGVTLYSSIDDDVPEGILSDPLRIQQVLSNLVSNVVKFNHTDCVEVNVATESASINDTTLLFSIHTNGQCPSAFSNWEQASEQAENENAYSGANMGLTIAKGIAQRMNGSIDFYIHDKGCTFEFRLSAEKDPNVNKHTRTVDSSYQINALVFSNNDAGYRELSSRLSEMGIHNRRAVSFPDVLTIAQKLHLEAKKHARYVPFAVIEAQTSQQTLDKIVLTQTIKTLVDELNIPVVLIAAVGQHENLQNILSGIDIFITQHPIVTPRFRKGVMSQLGFIKLNNDTPLPINNLQVTPMSILVVEDNPANTKLANAMLADFNAVVFNAATGGEAVELFQKNLFDLILMDVQLPDMSGCDVTRKIRDLEQDTHRTPRTPIVALTAHNLDDKKSELLLSGMDDFLGKPLSIKDVGSIIDRWVLLNKNTLSPQTKEPKITKKTNESRVISNGEEERKNSSPVSITQSIELAKNDASLAKDMLRMLMDSLPNDRELISHAFKEIDHETLYNSVHKLHGACCYCGVPRLALQCKITDRNLQNKTLSNLAQEIDEIINAIDELIFWNKEHDLTVLFDD